MKKHGLKLMDGVLIIMISEIDIRDWDKVDWETIDRALDSNKTNVIVSHAILIQLAEQVKEIYKKQTRHIPALERK